MRERGRGGTLNVAAFGTSSPVVDRPRAEVQDPVRINRPRVLAVGFVGLLLAFLAATTLIACAFALRLTQQLDEGEPVIYGLAQRILSGQSLYQPADQAQAYYTPLYIYVVAALRRVHFTGFEAGRAVSLVAGLYTAFLVAYLARRYAGSWWAGVLAVVMFLGLGFPLAPAPFLSLERVDLLGVAFSFTAITILSLSRRRGHVVLAGIAAGLALLTKQSFAAASLAGAVWLFTIDRRRALEFVAWVAGTLLIPALLLQWSSGGFFWDNVTVANAAVTSLDDGLFLVRELLVFQAVLFVLSVTYVVRIRAWRDPAMRLMFAYWLAALISLVGLFKVGANHNYWIELAGADAVLASLCIWSFLKVRVGLGRFDRVVRPIVAWIPVWLLAAQLGLVVPVRLTDTRDSRLVPPTATLVFERLSTLTTEAPEFNGLVENVSGERGLVVSESMDIAALANHRLIIEPFQARMYEQLGRWDSSPLVAEICSGQMTLLLLSYPLEKEDYPGAGAIWPRSVLIALRRSMVFEQIRAFHWLYRSKPNPDAQAIATCEADAAAARSSSAS